MKQVSFLKQSPLAFGLGLLLTTSSGTIAQDQPNSVPLLSTRCVRTNLNVAESSRDVSVGKEFFSSIFNISSNGILTCKVPSTDDSPLETLHLQFGLSDGTNGEDVLKVYIDGNVEASVSVQPGKIKTSVIKVSNARSVALELEDNSNGTLYFFKAEYKPAEMSSKAASFQYSRCHQSDNYCYQRGDYGPVIGQIIDLLIKKGYYQGNNDEIFGTLTETAIKNFQRDQELTPDGIAGPSTMDKLRRI